MLMGAIQVKNVPLDLHEAIRRRAAKHGMTIGGYLLMLARNDLERPTRAEWFDRVARRESVRGLDVAAAVRASRDERDQELMDALGR
jgi:plasmid stability protein